jgi:hypothetical protein
MKVQYEELIQKAIKAPSGHNTQPWKFKADENCITIYPDYTRSLPVVDADNHALFISLGCALENLIIAAKHYGFNASTAINTEQANKESITVQLIPSATKEDVLLYNFIDVRQATRNIYNGNPIPVYDIEKLKAASLQEDVQTVFFANGMDSKPIIDFVKEGNRLQFNNPSFIAELIKWIRFNKNTAIQKGDGLFGAATGNPSVPTWFGKLFMKLSANPEKEAGKWVKLIHSSSAIMIFIAERNDKKAWINVGRSFERTMLMAASLNINHAHANMPCEELEVRNKLSKQLNLLKEQQPLLLIRLGYSEKMPYSFRRPVEDVMLN